MSRYWASIFRRSCTALARRNENKLVKQGTLTIVMNNSKYYNSRRTTISSEKLQTNGRRIGELDVRCSMSSCRRRHRNGETNQPTLTITAMAMIMIIYHYYYLLYVYILLLHFIIPDICREAATIEFTGAQCGRRRTRKEKRKEKMRDRLIETETKRERERQTEREKEREFGTRALFPIELRRAALVADCAAYRRAARADRQIQERLGAIRHGGSRVSSHDRGNRLESRRRDDRKLDFTHSPGDRCVNGRLWRSIRFRWRLPRRERSGECAKTRDGIKARPSRVRTPGTLRGGEREREEVQEPRESTSWERFRRRCRT